jgi:DNA ligase-1
MLATKMQIADVPAGDYLMSPKYDGIRCLITAEGPRSRTGKPFANKHLMKMLSELDEGADGELLWVEPGSNFGMGNVPFHKTQSAVGTIDGPSSGFVYVIYDYFIYGAQRSAAFRQHLLESALTAPILIRDPNRPGHCGLQVMRAISVPVFSSESMVAAHRYLLGHGYEGVCLRPANACYKFGRASEKSMELIAVKEFSDDEAVVVGIIEREHNANEVDISPLGFQTRSTGREGKIGMDTMGGLRVKVTTGTYAGQTFTLSTGWKDHERQHIWDNYAAEYKGRTLTFKHQPHGGKDKPRIPTFLRWRDPE